jgi:hypothetical protein
MMRKKDQELRSRLVQGLAGQEAQKEVKDILLRAAQRSLSRSVRPAGWRIQLRRGKFRSQFT